MGMIKLTDGTLERHVEIDSDGKARSKLHQPTRDLILNRNAELRKNPGVIKPLSFMGLACTIPLEDWYNLIRKYPDLGSPIAEVQQPAFEKFLRSSESAIYRVQ